MIGSSNSPSSSSSAYVVGPQDYYRNFKQSIKAKDTLNSYDQKIKAFMKYNGISPDNFATLIEDNDTRQIESDIIDFILSLKEKHYSIASQKAYLSALIHFYSMNDVMIRRKKIAKFLSNDDNIICSEEATGSSEGGDVVGEGEKPYTREEIAKLLEFSDLREKVIIFWCPKNSAMIIANRVLDNKN